MVTQSLLLNASFEPLRVISWERAISLFYQNKVEIVATHEEVKRSVSFTFRVPSVVRLLRFVKVRQRRDYVPFTRSNIYARDGYKCGYCGDEKPTEDLTFDHVVPVAQGGRRDWGNIVSACIECNRKKGNRTPHEAGMTLLKQPKKPASTAMLRLTVGIRNMPKTWADFLYCGVTLEE